MTVQGKEKVKLERLTVALKRTHDSARQRKGKVGEIDR